MMPPGYSPFGACAARTVPAPPVPVPDAMTFAPIDLGLNAPMPFWDDLDAVSFMEPVNTGPVDYDFSVDAHPGNLGSTVGLACGNNHILLTFGPAAEADTGLSQCEGLCDLHPETASRIGLARYERFELERIPSDEGIYCFHGRARDVEGDERIFVLADARERAPLAGPELEHHIAAFERVFNRAARSLRTTIQERDPRRALR